MKSHIRYLTRRNSRLFFFFWEREREREFQPMVSKVLKPGPDRIIQPEKPWTSHNHSSLSLRTGLCQKNREPFEPSSTAQFWKPWSDCFSPFPLNLNLKKKNTEKQKKKKHNCWEEQANLTLLHSKKMTQIIQTQNTKQNPILTINLNKNK